MAGANNFSRLLIVNGQLHIMKDDMDLNSVQNFSSDILQQAIDDVTTTNSISPVVDSDNIGIISSDQNINVTGSGGNEYVAVLSNDQHAEETSTISLTLEQAAELGLHVTVDNMDQNPESGSDLKDIDIPSENNQYIISSEKQQNEPECIKLNSELCSFNEDVLNEDNGNDSFLDSFNGISLSKDQQLTLVPNIVNGTVTYTLQLSNQNITETVNSDYFRITEDSSVAAQNSVESGLKLDLSNLSTSSDLHFINSPVDIVSNKTVVDSAQSSIGSNNSSQAYGLVSCNSENVTFLSLSDAIPVGTNISDIVTHVNNTSLTQEHKSLLKTTSHSTDLTKQKVFVSRSGESILLKQKNIAVGQNGVNNGNSQIPKGKNKNVFSRQNQVSALPSKAVNNESTNCHLNISVEQKPANGKEFPTFLTTSKIDKLDSLLSEDEYVASLKQIETNSNKRTETSAGGKEIPKIITPAGGDVPKEVSVALSRIPIKTDCNKPLGSNENPIQLVQQGSTFHSMQALTEDHISKIKPILQENYDPKVSSKNVVYDATSNTRIIYRIISPAEVSLRKQDEFPRRRGRPKKIRSTESQPEESGEGAPPPKKFFPRTRSGRLSRPPKHMVRDYKHIRRAELDDSDGAYSDYQSGHEEELAPPLDTAPVDLLPGLVAKTKSHKRNISADNLCPTCGKIYLGYVRMKRHFDKYPDHGSIEYLNSIRNSQPDSEAENGGHMLWKKRAGRKKGRGKSNCIMTADKRTRLKEALEWCQNQEVAEIAGPAVASVLSLWELLMLRVDCVKQDSRVAALYKELYQLLCKLRQMAHRLFRPLDHPLPLGTKHVTVEVEDEIMTGLLNLPCGIYLASDEDLNETISTPTLQDHPLDDEQMQLIPTVSPVSLIEKKEKEKTVLDEISKPIKISIDEVPQPFLLTGEEMICDTDDRSLVNVDEIVSERLQNFTGSQSSSVDELMKGLNELDQRTKLETDDLMEGFSIVSRRTHVSASTEDLMKSLEHFESHLNHADAPSTLDRDSFDRVSNVDTLDFEVLSREFHSNNR